MTDKQNEAETIYRLGTIILDRLLNQELVDEDQYDRLRIMLAENLQAPFGQLESEDRLWKKES